MFILILIYTTPSTSLFCCITAHQELV